MPFAPGELIAGKYKVLDLIGTGGVGFVVSARHVRLDELVAIKFLRPAFASNPEAVKRFTIEARANFKIKNDHVVRVLDVDALESGAPFMVMELLEGEDLGRVLGTRGALPVEQAVEYALQACEAIAAAHACYVVHRDIKPENLFITGDGPERENVKVLDFGISKLALAAQPAQTGTVLGSPPYMSPEQVRAADEVDARTDIWSLGCVLYELLTGVAPFERASVPEICAAVVHDNAPPLRLMQPSLAPGLEAVVLRCLQKDPAQRYQDIAQLAAALVPFAPPEAAKFAERCRLLLDPSTAPVARPSAPPAESSTLLPEIAELRRASRRSSARLAAWGVAVLAVSYVLVRALGAEPPAVAPARAVPSAPVVQAGTVVPLEPSAAAVEPEAAPEPIVAPAPEASQASDSATPHKPATKPRMAPRVARRPSDEPDVGF
jgi:serine/threonine-protein kinase